MASPENSTILLLNYQGWPIFGRSIFSKQELENIIRQIISLPTRLGEKEQRQKIAEEITRQYIERGYITSKAEVVEQGIEIIEGQLTQVALSGRRRLYKDYLCDRIFLGISRPFNSIKLEEQLRLLSLDRRLADIRANLEPDGLGSSKLVVTVQEAEPWQFGLGVNNYSPPPVGATQFNLLAGYQTISGWGDEFLISYAPTATGGVHQLDFLYRIPLNPQEGK
jgi:hemolysin activation/secretion protein